MRVQELAKSLEEHRNGKDPLEIARLCLVMLNSVDDLETLDDEEVLRLACRDAALKLQFSTDQHAAMTQELEELAASDPKKFQNEQIWTLVRAIKVQSQVLQMYLGGEPLDI